jgi:ABC-type dipeptide/oligopeptide/nickel transport system ATPase component
LQVKDLHVYFVPAGVVQANSGVELELEEGTSWLLWRSGCGKTVLVTFIDALATILGE